MQFSQKPTKLQYFLSQPHQPFFLLGIINAAIFMLLFIPFYKGLLNIDAKFFHSYSMIFLVFTNFFYGFLYTTFTRFSGFPPIEPKRYLLVFLLNLFASIAFLLSIFLDFAFYTSSLLMAFSFAYTLKIFYGIYKKTTLPKKDQYWIIVSLGIGAISNLLFLLYYIPCSCKKEIFYDTGVNFGIYLYLLFLAFVVAFRMIPFFSHVMDWKKNRFLHIEIFTLFLLHSFLNGIYPKAIFLVDLVAAIILMYELIKIRLSLSKEPLLWILHLAIFWLPIALFIGSISEFLESWFGIYTFKLSLHILVLGFLTTVLIGFGTRVVLGHSGNLLMVDKTTIYIFYFTQIVLFFRLIFSIAGYFGKVTPFFDISATLWIILFIWWGAKYFKILAFGRVVSR